MFKTVEGIYQNGKVEFTEQPETTGDRVYTKPIASIQDPSCNSIQWKTIHGIKALARPTGHQL